MANKTTIGAGLKLDGEKEFKSAISDVNKNLSVLGSELQKVYAQNLNTTDSNKKATDVNNVLNKSIEEQKKKIETMRSALNEASLKYGENSTQVKNWQISLNKAEADLAKTTQKVDQNNEVLEKSNKTYTSVGDAIRKMTDVLGIKASPAIEGFASKMDKVSASGATLVLVLGGIAAALAKTTIASARTADELLTLSATTGLTVEKLQELNYASNFIDVSTDAMADSMKKLTVQMSNATKGSNESSMAFNKLRVSVLDNQKNLKSSEDVFYDVIDALGKVKNETERNALAMKIFGEEATRLNPLIKGGSGALRELAEEARTMGYVMGEDSVKKLGELNDAMDKFTATGTALKNSFAMALLPVLTTFFDVVSNIPTPVLQLVITLAATITTIVLVVKAIQEMSATTTAIAGFFKTFDAGALKTTAIIFGIVVALTALVASIVVLTGKSGEFNRMMSSVNQIGSNVPSYAKVNGSHRDGLDYVPYDGYVAELHKGEKILTASENARSGNNTFNVTIKADNIHKMADLVEMFDRLKQNNNSGRVVLV